MILPDYKYEKMDNSSTISFPTTFVISANSGAGPNVATMR